MNRKEEMVENEWIDVCDKLPERLKSVYVNSKEYGVRDGILLAKRAGGALDWNCDGVYFVQDVTHWMPKEYPEPPRHERFKAYTDVDGRTSLTFEGDGFSCSIQLICVEECPEPLVRWLNDRINWAMEHLGSR